MVRISGGRLQTAHECRAPTLRRSAPCSLATSRFKTRTDFVERRGRIEYLDQSFDLKFWREQTPQARFDGACELVVRARKVKGLDVCQLRLQRSVETFQRQQH